MEPELNFPEYDIAVRQNGSFEEVFDIARRRWCINTPEEWVRQHTIHYLINEKNIPVSLVAVEMPVKINSMDRRCDIVVYSNTGKPKMIVECKAPAVKISQSVVNQAGEYNSSLKAPFLMVTNGLKHFVFQIDFEKHSTNSLNQIPDYNYLSMH